MKDKVIFADFETFKNKKGNPEVVSWGAYNHKFYKYGLNIESFIEWIKTLKKKYYIYFHNGGKFDYKYLLPKLIKCGLKDKFKRSPNEIEGLYTIRSKYKEERIMESLLSNGEFSYIADDTYRIYTMTIMVNNVRIEFRDSNLLFPNQLKEYGNMLNQFYKTDKFTKGEEDYKNLHRWNSIEEFENSGNSFEYLKQDCYIGYEFLLMMEQYLKFNHWKITLGATTINDWARIFAKQEIEETGDYKKYIPSKSNGSFVLYIHKSNPNKPLREHIVIKQVLKKWFPVEWQDDFLELKNWFKGGLTHLNPQYRGIVLENELSVNKADINSSYPSSLHNALIPYGYPKREKYEGYDWSLLDIECKTDLVNEFGLPFIPKENGTHYTYEKIIPKGSLIKISTTELENFKKFYKGEYKITHRLNFRSRKGEFFFGTFIKKWMDLKIKAQKEENKGLEYFAKLMLNALYGKFGTKNIRKSKIYNSIENILDTEQAQNKYKFFMPVAIATTAASRQLLVEAVDNNYKHFVYCDTDSVVVVAKHWNKFNIPLDNNELGKWKLEKENWSGIFRRAKQYAEWKKNVTIKNKFYDYKLYITFAGLRIPEDYKFDLEKFIYGDKVHGQKRPKRVLEEGVLIEDYIKEIHPLWKDEADIDSWFVGKTIIARKESYEDNYIKQLEFIKKLV